MDGEMDWVHYPVRDGVGRGPIERVNGLRADLFLGRRLDPGQGGLSASDVRAARPGGGGLSLGARRAGGERDRGELGVGLLFGFLLALVSEMLSFTGQVLGFQFSFSLVNLLDPNSAIQTPLLGQMFTLFGTLVLIAAGLDRVLSRPLLRSFAAAPVGGVLLGARTGLAIVGMAGGIFAAALQLAAPALAATC